MEARAYIRFMKKLVGALTTDKHQLRFLLPPYVTAADRLQVHTSRARAGVFVWP